MNKKSIFGLVLVVAAILLGAYGLKSIESPSGNSNSVKQIDSQLVGNKLPAVTLADKDKNIFSIDSEAGKKVVLFFNEGLMCYPACWNQMASFGTDPRFNTDKIAAYSVIIDAPADWQRAIDQMPELGQAKILFDSAGKTSRELGLLALASSMHAGQMPGHTYVLIDDKGVVREIMDDPFMGLNNDKVLEKLQAY